MRESLNRESHLSICGIISTSNKNEMCFFVRVIFLHNNLWRDWILFTDEFQWIRRALSGCISEELSFDEAVRSRQRWVALRYQQQVPAAQAQLVLTGHWEETATEREGSGDTEDKSHLHNILLRGSSIHTLPSVDKQALVFLRCFVVFSKIVHLERQETNDFISHTNAILQRLWSKRQSRSLKGQI